MIASQWKGISYEVYSCHFHGCTGMFLKAIDWIWTQYFVTLHIIGTYLTIWFTLIRSLKTWNGKSFPIRGLGPHIQRMCAIGSSSKTDHTELRKYSFIERNQSFCAYSHAVLQPSVANLSSNYLWTKFIKTRHLTIPVVIKIQYWINLCALKLNRD